LFRAYSPGRWEHRRLCAVRTNSSAIIAYPCRWLTARAPTPTTLLCAAGPIRWKCRRGERIDIGATSDRAGGLVCYNEDIRTDMRWGSNAAARWASTLVRQAQAASGDDRRRDRWRWREHHHLAHRDTTC